MTHARSLGFIIYHIALNQFLSKGPHPCLVQPAPLRDCRDPVQHDSEGEGSNLLLNPSHPSNWAGRVSVNYKLQRFPPLCGKGWAKDSRHVWWWRWVLPVRGGEVWGGGNRVVANRPINNGTRGNLVPFEPRGLNLESFQEA